MPKEALADTIKEGESLVAALDENEALRLRARDAAQQAGVTVRHGAGSVRLADPNGDVAAGARRLRGRDRARLPQDRRRAFFE